MSYTIDRPVQFTGSMEERLANMATHLWIQWDPEDSAECDVCLAKSGSMTSAWPCGECPREVVTVDG